MNGYLDNEDHMSKSTNGESRKRRIRKKRAVSFFKPVSDGWEILPDPLDTRVPRGPHRDKTHREVIQIDPMWFYGYPKNVRNADPPAYLAQVRTVWYEHVCPLLDTVRGATASELETMKEEGRVSDRFVTAALEPRGDADSETERPSPASDDISEAIKIALRFAADDDASREGI